MSILANLGLFEKILIIFIILVLLKMVIDVNRFMKKRKEYMKLRENDRRTHYKKDANESGWGKSDENSNENSDEKSDENCEKSDDKYW